MPAVFCKCGGGIIQDGRCGKCSRTKNHKERTKTTKEAGRGHDWRTLSERYRAANPLCFDCLDAGMVTPVEEVHHIVPIEVDPSQRLELSNLVGLCKNCHKNRHKSF